MEKKERELWTVDSPAVPGRGEVSQVMHRARKTAMKCRPWFQAGELVPSSGRSGKKHWESFVPQRRNEVKKGSIWDWYEKSSLNQCPGEKMWFGSVCFFLPLTLVKAKVINYLPEFPHLFLSSATLLEETVGWKRVIPHCPGALGESAGNHFPCSTVDPRWGALPRESDEKQWRAIHLISKIESWRMDRVVKYRKEEMTSSPCDIDTNTWTPGRDAPCR